MFLIGRVLPDVVLDWVRQQKSVALSSSEEEYIAAILACCEAVWLRKMLFSLFGDCLDPTSELHQAYGESSIS